VDLVAQGHRFVRTVWDVALLELPQVPMKGQIGVIPHETTQKTQVTMAGFIRVPEHMVSRFVNVEPVSLAPFRVALSRARLMRRQLVFSSTTAISSSARS
jgi:hypothetical protein